MKTTNRIMTIDFKVRALTDFGIVRDTRFDPATGVLSVTVECEGPPLFNFDACKIMHENLGAPLADALLDQWHDEYMRALMVNAMMRKE